MKKLITLLLILVGAAGLQLQAQDKAGAQIDDYLLMTTADARAEALTSVISEALSLTDEQNEQILAANVMCGKRVDAILGKDHPVEMKQQILMAMEVVRDGEYRKILTEQQFAEYELHKAEFLENRKARTAVSIEEVPND